MSDRSSSLNMVTILLLVCLTVICNFQTVHSKNIHQHGSLDAHNKSIIQMEQQCKDPLCKYLMTSEDSQSRHKRQAFSEHFIPQEKKLEHLIAEQPDNHVTYKEGQSKRNRRSITAVNEPIGKINKDIITWRLMSGDAYPSLTLDVQNDIFAQAFRYWAEVAPICFRKDQTSARVDIELGFFEGVHLNDFIQFDGRGGEISHKFNRDIHFDKADLFTASTTTSTSVSLLLAAVHEIGHVLGLNHSSIPGSVMNPSDYLNIQGVSVLSDNDRSEIKTLYGPCTGRFDIAMDFVKNDGTSRVYTTYFFKNAAFWAYSNNNNRVASGYPKELPNAEWNGVPSDLDTYVHYFISDTNGRNGVTEQYFFFKGGSYYQYNPDTAVVTNSGFIRELFKSGASNAYTMPNNLDAAFYDFPTEQIFFFKGSQVYKYSYRITGNHSCCTEPPKNITTLFPPATQADLTAPSGVTYANDLDTVYLSWKSPYPLYLIKGEEVWQVENYSIAGPYVESNFRVRYVGKWNTIWNYICEADC